MINSNYLLVSILLFISMNAYAVPPNAHATANGWGCESSTPTTKYVAKIETTENGRVSVEIQGIDSLANTKHFILEPQDSSGNPLLKASVGSTTVYQWECGSDDANVIGWLPGSCGHKF